MEKIILAIDTSCDETSVAVTRGVKILANVVWSQAAQHAKFGGVMPSLAQRMHEERIDWVINKAMKSSGLKVQEINAIAVTEGPGLAIALGVGIKKAKELAEKLKIPLIGINHIEGHLLSPLAVSRLREENFSGVTFPVLGLVVSGGHTELVLIKEIGKYEILAMTTDDALGEALDKAARMIGLGYPGGAIMEKMARLGNSKTYPLPLPMSNNLIRNRMSYSGLKTAMYRLVEKTGKDLSKKQICNLAATFQNRAFQHLERVVFQSIRDSGNGHVNNLFVGGGVAANLELRKRLRKLTTEFGMKVSFPYSNKMCGDNAGMIGVVAGFKIQNAEFKALEIDEIDRKPRWKIEQV